MGWEEQSRGSGRRRILHTTLRKCINGILMLRYFTGRQFGGGQLRVQVTVRPSNGAAVSGIPTMRIKSQNYKKL